jgi:hypothetical protein
MLVGMSTERMQGFTKIRASRFLTEPSFFFLQKFVGKKKPKTPSLDYKVKLAFQETSE